MGSNAPSESPPDDDTPPGPPKGSGSKSSPAPTKSTARSPPPADDDDDTPSPPPPSPKKSPPPPDQSPPPPPDEESPPPPSPKKSPSQPPASPPPADASPPPASPAPSKGNKSPPAEATQPKPTPVQTPPVDDGTKNPAQPADGVNAGTPPAPTGKAFVAPSPALASNHSSPGSSGSKGGSSSSHAGAIAGGVIGGALFVMFLVCIWMFCRRKKKQQKNYNQIWNHSPSPDRDLKQHAINIPPGGGGWGPPSPSPGYLPPRPPPGLSDSGAYNPYYGGHNRTPGGSTLPPFSPDIGGAMNQNNLAYEDLVAATDGFASSNMLGQGGFGYVHKGVLPGGKEVAVKCLKSGSGQGEREFQAEVDIISRVHHRHLVSLVGYSIANEKRLLVYEFVPNNTLEYHLHKSRNPPLDFSTRVRIALGSAKGLAYLHEDCHPRIIHRDIKAANILLDYNFEAQVADFGLARLSNDANTHVSTRVMGTFGYLAPEYASSGKLTDKSDVFSFGVVLLELITGRRPIDPNDQSMEDDSLVDWARPLLSKAVSDGVYDELVDQRLEGNYNAQEMTNMVACAAASIRHSAKRRPRMSQIVRTLEGDMSGLDGARTGLNTPTSTDYDTAAYNADMKKFRQMAFGTLELDGGSATTTSEYDLNHSTSTSIASSNENSPRKT